MVFMDLVIERGQARCPRCVAVADYFFIESSPNLLRYEVNCGRCGEQYREVHGPPAVGVLATTPEWLPAAVEAPAVPLRERLLAVAVAARVRFSAVVTAIGQHPLPDWMAGLLARARQ